MTIHRFYLCLLAATLMMMMGGCRTDLVQAIRSDRADDVKTLLDGGANINEFDTEQFTPLHWAAYYGKTDMVKLLLSRGAQANARSAVYGTPLTIAAQYGFTDTVRALIEKGADATIADAAGQTALSYAEAQKDEAMIRLLKGSASPAAPGIPPAAPPLPSPSASSPAAAARVKSPLRPAAAEASRQTSPLNIAVFHFTSLNVEASAYGFTTANAFIDTLKKEPRLIVLDRRELETFLLANDFHQQDTIENVVRIGSRLGLQYVIAGNIEKKGALIVIHGKVFSISKRKVVFSRKSISAGEGKLIPDVGKMGDEMIDFILNHPS